MCNKFENKEVVKSSKKALYIVTLMATFEPEQVLTAEEIVRMIIAMQTFYIILLAQMQSGKTGTYMKVAIDSIVNGSVEHVMIISGSPSLDLKKQCEDDLAGYIAGYIAEKKELVNKELSKLNIASEALEAFPDLRDPILKKIDNCEIDMEKIDDLGIKLTSAIKIHWANDLNKINEIPKNTLIIHDESHYAQSMHNRPYKFYKKHRIGLALKGDDHEIRKKNIHILSVSATPFSEYISNQKVKGDIYNNEERAEIGNTILTSKSQITATPGKAYKGIKQFIDGGHLKFEAEPVKKDNHAHLSRTLIANSSKYDNKWCIIRTHGAENNGDSNTVKQIAEDCNYNYISVFCDSVDKSLKLLKDAPTGKFNKTIVHISGICRMGQVLDKTHIGMVYEQSKGPKSDSILQSLMGRMCGYYNTDIPDIFISKNAEKDIRKYASFWAGETTDMVVKKAMNLSGGENKHTSMCGNVLKDKDGELWAKIVPVKFNAKDSQGDGEAKKPDWNDINNMLIDYPELIRDDIDKAEILQIVNIQASIGGGIRDIMKKTYMDRNIKKSLNEACSQNKRFTELLSNNICDYNTADVKSLQMIGSHLDGGTCFLVGCVKYDQMKHGNVSFAMPNIHKQCNYGPWNIEQEDGSVIENMNGGQFIKMPKETADNKEVFVKYIIGAIKRSIQGCDEYCGADKSINSMYCARDKIFKGIYLSNEFAKTKKQQKEITSQINRIIDVDVKIEWNSKSVKNFKDEGQIVPAGYKGFTSITW